MDMLKTALCNELRIELEKFQLEPTNDRALKIRSLENHLSAIERQEKVA